MNPNPIVIQPADLATMTTAVVVAVQLARWMLPRAWAVDVEAFLVMGLSILVGGTWYVSSAGHPPAPIDAWPLLLLALTLMAAAAGVFGFVRANAAQNVAPVGRDLARGAPTLPGRRYDPMPAPTLPPPTLPNPSEGITTGTPAAEPKPE